MDVPNKHSLKFQFIVASNGLSFFILVIFTDAVDMHVVVSHSTNKTVLCDDDIIVSVSEVFCYNKISFPWWPGSHERFGSELHCWSH